MIRRPPRLASTPAPLLALGLVALAGCADPPRASLEGRGVLVIAIDGLRADHVSSMGYDRDTTPSIDALAADALTFRQAYSTAPWALPAHVSLLSGCDPNVARRMLPPGAPETLLTVWNIAERTPRLAREFLKRGYRTAAFFEHPRLTPVHGLDPGFESYRVGRGSGGGASAVAQTFLHWLRGLDRHQNWFAYVQLEDLGRIWRSVDLKWDTYFPMRPELDYVPPVSMADHAFFAIPRENWTGGLDTLGEYEAEYDGAIRRVDQEVGRLVKQLMRDRRFNRTTFAVVGTHGMGFGEAGLILDHGTLTEVDLHVPMIIRPFEHGIPGAPDPWARGRSIAAVASLTDLAPTLLDVAGIEVPAEMQGVSHVAVMRDPKEPGPRRFAFASCGRQGGYAVMDSRWTFEARMPFASHRGLSRSWYGDEQRHPDDYCELLWDRRGPMVTACGAPRIGDAIARDMRAAGREAFERVHAIRLDHQETGWGVRPSDVAMVPSVALWKAERFR